MPPTATATPPLIDFDDLAQTVTTEELAQMVVATSLFVLRRDEGTLDLSRARFADAVAIASRFMSFGDLATLTNLDRGYLHRLARTSKFHTAEVATG